MGIHNDILEHHYKAHRDRLVKVVYNRVGRCPYLAEDAVQEAYKRALVYIHCYDPEKTFDGWFITILNNSVKDIMREERHRGLSLELVENVPSNVNINTSIYKKSIVKKINSVENRLHRYILKLYVINGLDYKDIVLITNAPSQEMVYKVVSRFKKGLK